MCFEIPFLDVRFTKPTLSYIGAISSGMRASPSSFSQSFYISPTSVCPCHHFQCRRTHLTPCLGTGIGAVYTLTLVGQNVVFNQEQERITNSFFSCTLALNAVCTGAFFVLRCSTGGGQRLTFIFRPGLIAFRIWRTQRQTSDAKIGSNLMQVSVIVIESGAFHLFRSRSLRPCDIHTCVIANRSDLSKRVSMCSRKLHDQVASLQHLFGCRKPILPLSFLNLR